MMQYFCAVLAITIALLRTVGAQDDPKLTLVFTSTGAGNDCGRSSNAGNPFSMTLRSVPRSDVCFTFGDLLQKNYGNLTNTTTGYRDPMEPCPDDTPDCGIEYTLEGIRDSSSDVLYQQVFYQQSATNSSDEIGQLALTTYPGFQCLAENPQLGPWYAWTCASEQGQCSDTGSPIGSFTIGPVQEEWRNNGSCFVAAQEAKGLALGVPGLLLPAVLTAMALSFM